LGREWGQGENREGKGWRNGKVREGRGGEREEYDQLYNLPMLAGLQQQCPLLYCSIATMVLSCLVFEI